MAKKQEQSSLFEIVVVLSIVFIVAFTGQVLIHYESQGRTSLSASNGVTGLVVGGSGGESARSKFLDVSVKSIDVNPPSPFIGEPFEVKVTVSNEGFVDTLTPFYVKLEVLSDEQGAKPTVLFAPIPMSLRPGEETSVSFSITMVTKEGPLRIIASADATSKLGDKNPANNKMSETVIITS